MNGRNLISSHCIIITYRKIFLNVNKFYQLKEFGETRACPDSECNERIGIQPVRLLGMGSHKNGFPFLLCGKCISYTPKKLIIIIQV